MLKSGHDALVYTKRNELLEHIRKARKAVQKEIENIQPRECVDAVAKVYSKLAETNTIDGAGPVFPEGLAQIYKNEPGLKMLQDDLRFYLFNEFASLERNFDLGRYNEILNVIGESLHAATLEEMRSQQRVLNKTVIKYMIAPGDMIDHVKLFVNSTVFLFVPMTEEETNTLAKSSPHRPEPDSRNIWNIEKNIRDMQNRVLKATDPELVALINKISEQATRDELKKFLGL